MKLFGNFPNLEWSVVRHAKSYSNTSPDPCSLCLQEKLEILSYENKMELLKKRLSVGT